MSQPLVRASGVRMSFGGAEVLKGVDLELLPGEVHAIVGENGAGKSTLAKIVAGVHRPSSGEIFLRGTPVNLEGPRQALSLGIALIHQEPLTFPDLDVAENIFAGHLPASRGQVDWNRMRTQAKQILDSLGLKIDTRAKARELSVADQQMIELASALSHGASVVLMDETTASLTPKEVAELFKIVRNLRDEGKAIAFVTHHLEEVFDIADRITVLRDGERVASLLPGETSIPEIVKLMVGRVIEDRMAHTLPTGQKSSDQIPAVLEVRDLSASGKFSGISFSLNAGEIVGLGGLVGAGRTDVCRALFGIQKTQAGAIRVQGRSVKVSSPRSAMALGIAMVPEDRQHEGLLLPMSLSENVCLAVLRRLNPFGWLRRRRESQSATAILRKLHTAFRDASQPARDLSGGNQQKLVLAKWLLTQPRVLILDEPTRGVDVGAKDEIYTLIRELVAEGMAILLVSSDLPELLFLSDRVLVIHEGRLRGEFDREQATPERVMLAATGQEVNVA